MQELAGAQAELAAHLSTKVVCSLSPYDFKEAVLPNFTVYAAESHTASNSCTLHQCDQLYYQSKHNTALQRLPERYRLLPSESPFVLQTVQGTPVEGALASNVPASQEVRTAMTFPMTSKPGW